MRIVQRQIVLRSQQPVSSNTSKQWLSLSFFQTNFWEINEYLKEMNIKGVPILAEQ